MSYIQNVDQNSSDCIFCVKPSESSEKDKTNLILYRGKHCFIILNLYPYNNGHCMVVPYRHINDCCAVNDDEAIELWHLINKCKTALKNDFHPDGFNIGMNIGRTAGAGIDQHIHAHIVPRWNGDTNFMPVIGKTKLISQDIHDTYDTLLSYFTTHDQSD